MNIRSSLALISPAFAFGLAPFAHAQTYAPAYAEVYSFVDLGTPVGVPANLGGLIIKPSEPNFLYIMGGANGGSGQLFKVPLNRSPRGQILGYAGPAVLVSPAANNDGGLELMPNGTLLYTTFNTNTIGQILAGGSTTFSNTPLSPLGVSSSTGTMRLVPAGYPGAGNLIVISYSASTVYTVPYTLQPDGSYTFAAATLRSSISGGPEGIVYVPSGSPIFPTTPTMLICEYSLGNVVSYEVGANGEPIAATRSPFITGLSNVEGGCIDPRTNVFLFSTYGGGNRVIVARGFNPPPCGPSDVGRQGGFNGHDGVLDNNDFVAFVNYFFANNAIADFGSSGGTPGADGLFDNNDFVVYVDAFFNDLANCTG